VCRCDDDRLIVNMSVWTSLEALGEFVYGSAHSSVMRRRRDWFEKMPELFTALWWIPAGTLPSVADAEELSSNCAVTDRRPGLSRFESRSLPLDRTTKVTA
jgi:hypothetical protein